MLRFSALWLGLTLAACGPLPVVEPDAGPGTDASLADAGAPRALFVLPREDAPTETFFDLPFPNDVRRTAAGTTDFSAFPNPRRNSFVRRYVDAMTARLDGFATNGAVYFRFSQPVDPSTLDDATVRLVDLEDGAAQPAVIHYQERATVFWSANTVAVRPVYGVRCAAVVATPPS